MFHGWMFDPDGDQAAADSTRSSTSLDTGSSVNPRTARRLVTASYTSMMAYLTLIGSLVRSLNPLERAWMELKFAPGFLVRSALSLVAEYQFVNHSVGLNPFDGGLHGIAFSASAMIG